MGDGAISQAELDKLFGGVQDLEPIEELQPAQFTEVWIVKNIKTGGVVGGRCHNKLEANSLMYKAQKDYPDGVFEVRKVR